MTFSLIRTILVGLFLIVMVSCTSDGGGSDDAGAAGDASSDADADTDTDLDAGEDSILEDGGGGENCLSTPILTSGKRTLLTADAAICRQFSPITMEKLVSVSGITTRQRKTELNKYNSWNTKKALAKREIADISKPIPVTDVTRRPAKEPAKITSKALNHEDVDLTYKYRENNEL